MANPLSPESNSKSKLTGLLGKVVTFIAAVIAAVAVQGCSKRSDSTPPVRTFSSSEWSVRNLTDITLDAPFDFGPGPDIMKNLTPEVREMIERYEILDSGEKSNPRSTVSRIVYKPGVDLSLDGSVEGAMQGAMRPFIKAGGDPNADYTATPTKIDGLEARRASFSGKVRGNEIHVDAVFVLSGQKLWQVQVLCTSKESVPDAKRILDSIHISPN